MDIFDDITSPYDDAYASILTRSTAGLLQNIDNLRNKCLSLGPLIERCIETQWHEGFRLCLNMSNARALYGGIAEAAAKSSDSYFLIALLDHGWPIDAPLRDGFVPSVLGLSLGNEDLLRTLLARGADPNAQSSVGHTALSAAVRSASIKTVHILIDAGGDVRLGDLLHCSVQRRQQSHTREIMSLLISRGAPVEAIEYEARRARQLRGDLVRGTALHLACQLRNRIAVSTLLEHGANPHSTRRYYEEEELTTPLEIARVNGDAEIENLLEEAWRDRQGGNF